MLIITLISTLAICFCIHIFFLIKYIQRHQEKFLWRFINAVVVNIFLAAGCILIAIFRPAEIANMNVTLLVWILAGIMMAAMLIFQILIFHRIYKRSKLPEHYHYNFFGKKVLHSTVAHPAEVGLFFASIPFLLFAGAYFIARLIKFFI
ncbi:MAG: hypothetical protein JW807_15705 [Spirochaetes bacterium]|nr:hypothetical protein [Spirochaetota bacterium]